MTDNGESDNKNDELDKITRELLSRNLETGAETHLTFAEMNG